MKWRIRIKERGHWFLRHATSFPFIMMPLIPAIMFDISIEIYQQICFPLFGIPHVDRSKYIIFDRAKLPYLKWYEKFYCMYCSYVNGMIAYTGRIAGDTESYWCAIKHRGFDGYVEPPHQADFVPYGDEDAFHERFGK
ncbi:hypothetical protein HYS00_05355 [Candidatus Microgenomates bacterium]|nr:hypothetical protein [Candidatus Microgenomates bacterium]